MEKMKVVTNHAVPKHMSRRANPGDRPGLSLGHWRAHPKWILGELAALHTLSDIAAAGDVSKDTVRAALGRKGPARVKVIYEPAFRRMVAGLWGERWADADMLDIETELHSRFNAAMTSRHRERTEQLYREHFPA